MSDSSMTNAERAAALTRREVGEDELGRLIDMFPDPRVNEVPPGGIDESALNGNYQMEILMEHGPPGANPSNNPLIEELKEILKESLQLHGELCDERLGEILAVLAILEGGGSLTPEQQNELFGLLNSADLRDRVNPELIVLLLNALSDKVEGDESKSRTVVATPSKKTNVSSMPNKPPWRGGGIVDDLFRVPLLYMRFRLTSAESSKYSILREMMSIAINAKSWTAYKTVVDLNGPLPKGKTIFDFIPKDIDQSELSKFVTKYREHFIFDYKLPEPLQAIISREYAESVNPPTQLAKFTVPGLVDFIRLCKSSTDQTTFRGDGFSTPFETNHTDNQNPETMQFNIIEAYGRFIKATHRDGTDMWVLMIDSIDSPDTNKTLFWIRDDVFVSGEFEFDPYDNTILKMTNEYICAVVGSGAFGSVLRVSRKTNNVIKSYAVKFFNNEYDFDLEDESALIVLQCFGSTLLF